MSGLSIDQSGKIIGTYTNGEKRVLGQIAVTTFSNPSGWKQWETVCLQHL